MLDEQGRPVPDGETGEICVRGVSLALGYYNNPEKTGQVFVPNPLQKHYRELVYRTGDLGPRQPYGEILYVARKDNQIKHMGHRIELGEIETAIAALEGIRRVCCLYDQARGKIVAVYEGDLDRTQVIDGIKHALPKVHDPQRLPPGGGYAHQPERQDRPRPPDGGVHPCKGLTSWQQYLDLKAEAKARGLTLSNLYFLPGQARQKIDAGRLYCRRTRRGPAGCFWTRAGGFYRCYYSLRRRRPAPRCSWTGMR